MKKLLLILLAMIGCFVWSTFAANCLSIQFNNWNSICLDFDKSTSNGLRMSVKNSNLEKSSDLRCYVILQNNNMYPINNCEWSFYSAGTNSQKINILATYVVPSGNIYSSKIAVNINFSKWTWSNVSMIRSSGSAVRNNNSSKRTNTTTTSSTRRSTTYNNKLKLSAFPSFVNIEEWVGLEIETDDNYSGKVDFTLLQYRSSDYNSWTTISRTSSTYISDYAKEWNNGSYKMTYADDGEKTFSRFIKFRKSWYYRIYAEDDSNNKDYVQIYVKDSSFSSPSYENKRNKKLELWTNRYSPSTNQFVNLEIETDDNYVGKLTFSAKYRRSSSSSWTTISNLTSSSYFSDYSSIWEDGYYRIKLSDDGDVILKNLIKFKKEGYYRIYVKDVDWNENYIQFSVEDDYYDNDYDYDYDYHDWFSASQISKLKKIYNSRNSMIAEMQRQYPNLKKDKYWIKLSENFYNDMKDVLNNKRYRDFEDFDDFNSAFDDRYEYTMTNI